MSSWPLRAVAQHRRPWRSAPRARRGAAGGWGERRGRARPNRPLHRRPKATVPTNRAVLRPLAPGPPRPAGEARSRRRARRAAPGGGGRDRGRPGPATVGPGGDPHSSWLTSAGEPRLSGGFSASRARSCSESCSLLGMEFFLGRPLGLVGDSRPPPCNTCEAGREGRGGGHPGKTVLPSARAGRNLPLPRPPEQSTDPRRSPPAPAGPSCKAGRARTGPGAQATLALNTGATCIFSITVTAVISWPGRHAEERAGGAALGTPAGRGPGAHKRRTRALTIFFHFMRLFWYQVFTWSWLSPSDSARSILRAREREREAVSPGSFRLGWQLSSFRRKNEPPARPGPGPEGPASPTCRAWRGISASRSASPAP